jgi:hypothetical protein
MGIAHWDRSNAARTGMIDGPLHQLRSLAFVAKVIRAKLRGEPVSHAFSYRHMGSLATIGRKSAVADFGFVRLRGAMAWWLWGIVHVLFLLGSRNRVAVVLNWIWSYVTYRASTRLITDSSPQVVTAIK